MLDKNRFILYLIRHGESAVNVQPDMIGQDPETPLTKRGEEQALALRNHFNKCRVRFDHSYASDYTRASETARIVCEKNYMTTTIICPELREYSPGDWRHGSRKEIMTPEIQLKMSNLNTSFQPPHGESLAQVERRASKWLEDTVLYNEKIIEEAYTETFHYWKGDKLVAETRPRSAMNALKIGVFSHGMTIKCLLHYVMGFDKSITWKVDIDNTSVSALSFNLTGEIGWRVHGINDTSHLK